MFNFCLVELLKRRERYSLHAAGFCVGGRGLLLPGTSGAGKSTLSLALLRAGCSFLGDDTLFLAAGPDGLRVMAFPDEVDITDETAGFFPELHGLLRRPKPSGGPKRQILAEEVYGPVSSPNASRPSWSSPGSRGQRGAAWRRWILLRRCWSWRPTCC